MNDFSRFYAGLEKINGAAEFERWRDSLPQRLAQALHPQAHGRIGEWSALLGRLPRLPAARTIYDSAVCMLPASPLAQAELEELRRLLLEFKPWRKGPFDIHGIYI